MKILITGSEGNVGRRLISHLSLNHEVFGIDIKQEYRPNFKTADINNGADMINIFYTFQPDVVIHLAAMVSRVTCELSPVTTIKTNVYGTQNVIQLCKQVDARLMFFSTSEVYGNIDGILSETRSDLHPENIYGLSKLMGEQLVRYTGDTHLIVRPFMLYDETETRGSHRSAMIRFAENLLQGNQIEVHRNSVRSWLHMDDAVVIIERLLYWHDIVNIGSAESIETAVLAKMMCDYIGCSKSLIKLIDQPERMIQNKYPDLDRQFRMTKYTPKISIETGIKRVIDHVRATL